MKDRTYKRIALLCLAIALAVALTAAAGVFLRGDGSTAAGESIQGKRFRYATTGIYKWNPELIVAEGAGWDAVTLFLAVPALLLALPGVSRGSLKARLFAIGVLGYFVYQYLMYSVFWVLGPQFPMFVIIYPVAFAAIVWIMSTIDVASLPERFSERFPRRGMAGLCFLMDTMLILMWTRRIVAGLSGDLETAELLGMPTLTVQALDLGIIVPITFLTGVLALRRHPWGYLLTAVFAIKGVSMTAAICAMLISAWMVEGKLDVGPFAIFGVATAAAVWIAALVFRSALPEEPLVAT